MEGSEGGQAFADVMRMLTNRISILVSQPTQGLDRCKSVSTSLAARHGHLPLVEQSNPGSRKHFTELVADGIETDQ